MGLQTKQGEKTEGQQFDIRAAVDEFRSSINMYLFWEPGMEIFVSHLLRRQIPSYVFPEGYRRIRCKASAMHQGEKTPPDDGDGGRYLKRRKKNLEGDDFKQEVSVKHKSISPGRSGLASPEVISNHKSGNSPMDSPKVSLDGKEGICDSSAPVIMALGEEPNFGGVDERWQKDGMIKQDNSFDCGSNSNSSVVTASGCEVSSFECVEVEGKRSTEGSAEGSNNPRSSSTGDSCEADSLLAMEGLQEESEVLDSLPFYSNIC